MLFRCRGNFSGAGGNDGSDGLGAGDSDEDDEDKRAAFERAVTEVVNRVTQDAEKNMGDRGGGVQNAAFESLQVRTLFFRTVCTMHVLWLHLLCLETCLLGHDGRTISRFLPLLGR